MALCASALIISTIIFHRVFGMPTPLALNLFGLAFALAGLSLLTGAFALLWIWRHGTRGPANTLVGMTMAILVLLWPLSLIPKVRNLPAINDVTTDMASPPQFLAVARLRPPGANSATYPGPATAELQKAFYRNIQPLILARPPQDAFDLAGLALRKLRLTTVAETPVGTDGRAWGVIEAYDRTLAFGFYDDVVIRVSPLGRGSRIDVRSASRFGRHDLGANAARVRHILNEIVARADASVGGKQSPANDRRTSSRRDR